MCYLEESWISLDKQMMIATEALARIEGDKSLSERVLNALKASGVSAFEQILNHSAASFVIGALEDWQKTKVA